VSSKIKLKLTSGGIALSRRNQKLGKVLLVDDEQANLDGLEAALSRSYEVFQTTDPQAAISLSRSHHIDLVITDQRMPQMLGTELLQQLCDEQPHQIRILLTGYTDAGDLIACINDGLLQLGQVLLNLVNNAIYASLQRHPDAAKVSVRAVAEDEQLLVTVSDNGGGISEEVQAKIFDPFFTTKPVGEGTGLGLSICFRIIETHKGTLTFDSSPEAGTTFKISLPFDALKDQY
jgi:signal transduction histidine kinase